MRGGVRGRERNGMMKRGEEEEWEGRERRREGERGMGGMRREGGRGMGEMKRGGREGGRERNEEESTII